MLKFKDAVSSNFNPDEDLIKVGLANQTTMYKRETRAIGRLLEKALLEKYGPLSLSEHYLELDTICDATQERQDAVTEMVTTQRERQTETQTQTERQTETETEKPDLVLVIGGFDSSNTAHLKEIPEKFGVRAFHIDRAECIRADNSIRHREENGDMVVTPDFLPRETKRGGLVIGVTSGASTPDR